MGNRDRTEQINFQTERTHTITESKCTKITHGTRKVTSFVRRLIACASDTAACMSFCISGRPFSTRQPAIEASESLLLCELSVVLVTKTLTCSAGAAATSLLFRTICCKSY